MISHQPGLIPQVTGILTYDRYWGAVTMIDYYTDIVYSCLIRSTSMEETLAAKHAYERVMDQYGYRVHSYHGDNSRFDSKEF
eukprot:1172627-Ditylum_brightwellii.AAC.1